MKIQPNVIILLICLALTVFFTSLVVETQRGKTNLASIRNTVDTGIPDAFAVPPLSAGKRTIPAVDENADVSGLLRDGQHFFRAGNYEAAGKVYEAVLAKQADNLSALGGLGLVKFIRQDYASAETHLTRYLETAKKDDPMLRMHLGVALMRQQKYTQALEEMERVLKVDSKDGALHLGIACINARLKNKEKAMSHLTSAFNLMGPSILSHISNPDLDNLRDLTSFQNLVQAAMKKHQPEQTMASQPTK